MIVCLIVFIGFAVVLILGVDCGSILCVCFGVSLLLLIVLV